LEQDGSEWMGLVNTISDSAAKKSSKMSQQNLEYFKTCLGLIAGEDSGWISSSMLLAAVDRLQKKMTKKNAQDFLRAQVADKWFIQEEGYYSMGPRSVLELFPFLPDVIDQPVDECHVCSVYVVMVTTDYSCFNFGNYRDKGVRTAILNSTYIVFRIWKNFVKDIKSKF
jgi:hypothetical protein